MILHWPLAGLLLLLSLVQAQPAQVPLSLPTSISLVDLLSASPQHSLLLSAFQRARLIPLLNRLNGSTFFAPTNDAISAERDREKKRGALEDAIWTFATGSDGATDEGEDDEGSYEGLRQPPRDNLQLALRDTLLYHILNYTLFPAPTNSSTNSSFSSPLPLNSPTLQQTLYYPSLTPLNSTFPAPPTLPGTPPDDPDAPSSEEGLLRGEGQRVRVVRKDAAIKGEKGIWVGGDWKGQGGARVVEGSLQFAKNGAFISLEGVLQKPVDLAKHIRTNPSLSTLASLLPPALLDYISTTAHTTIFAPTNEAWNALSDLELRFLRSGFAETDLTEILGDGTSKEGIGAGKVGYMRRLLGRDNGTTISTILGGSLTVTAGENGEPFVNGTSIEEGDILASNGVLHTVPSLLLPSGSLQLTAEKSLIALNATTFVALLRSVNLSHYVQLPSGSPSSLSSTSYTILAPRDDVLGNEGWRKTLPPPGSPALKEVLEYHIVSGKWTTEELDDGMLVGTELRGLHLKGARQKLAVSVHEAETVERGWGWLGASEKKVSDRKSGVVGFGGASVLADPVQVGDSIIYLLASVLEPPSSVVTTAVSDLRLSTFVAAVYAASLDKTLSKSPAITYLIPHNPAFTSLGLVMSYLLLPTARDELRSLIRYHAIDEIVYLDEFPIGGALRYPTLDGAEIYVERESSNATLAIHGPTIGGHPANGETRDARLIEGDILTSSGVVHIIDQVELPPSMNIGVAKLLQGAKATTFADLIRAANMSWILEGKPPPPSSDLSTSGRRKRIKRRAKADRAYTVLCPTDKALSRLNLTYYLSNSRALSSLVKLHIIPTDAFAPLSSDGHPLPLVDEITYSTLLDVKQGGESQYGTVAFRRWGEEGWLVGIKSARGTEGASDSARVVGYGRATPWFVPVERETPDPLGVEGEMRLAGGGGVLTIDSVLLPYEPGWFRRWGWIGVVVGLGVLGGVTMGAMGWKVWKGRERVEYQPVEGEED